MKLHLVAFMIMGVVCVVFITNLPKTKTQTNVYVKSMRVRDLEPVEPVLVEPVLEPAFGWKIPLPEPEPEPEPEPVLEKTLESEPVLVPAFDGWKIPLPEPEPLAPEPVLEKTLESEPVLVPAFGWKIPLPEPEPEPPELEPEPLEKTLVSEPLALTKTIVFTTRNRYGYVRLLADSLAWMKAYEHARIHIFDDGSTDFSVEELKTWFEYAHVHESDHQNPDMSTRHSFEWFESESKDDILITIDSDTMLHPDWHKFIDTHIDTSGVLSLYHSAAKYHKSVNCNNVTCEKGSTGAMGMVMTRKVVTDMLRNMHAAKHAAGAFDWGFVDYFKKKGIKIIVPKTSLALHYGMYGAHGSGNHVEVANTFDFTPFPDDISRRARVFLDNEKPDRPHEFVTHLHLDYPNGMKQPLSWSQYGQDRYIANAMPNGKYFIEIGGYDGEKFSNTLLLEKEYGWNGLLVEANPYTFEILKGRNRKAKSANTCIGNDSLTFKISGSTSSSIDFITSTHLKRINKDINTYGKSGDKRWSHSGEEVTIECVSIMTLIDSTDIDYFSLDVEGSELYILQRLEWDKLNIKVFSVEVDQHKKEIIDFMSNKGYNIETELQGDIIFKKRSRVGTPKIFLCGYPLDYLSFIYPDRTVETYNGLKTSTANDIMLNGLFGPPCDIETFKGNVIHINGESSTNVPTNTYGPGGNMFYYIQAVFQRIPDAYDLISNRPTNTKEKFMYYVNSNCIKFRDEVFDKLSTIKHVDALGACKNNVKDFHTRSQWANNWKTLSGYRFGLCMENKKAPGYITEKILMAFFAGVIPVYYGTEEVFDIFNRNSFIYYDIKNPEKSVAEIKYLEENPDKYEKMLHEPILNDGSYEKYFAQEAVWALLTRATGTSTTRKVSENLRPTRKELEEIPTIEKKDIVIVFPYRDRAIHYKKIMEHLPSITRENWRIHTILVEQDDKSPFRRSWLLNIGIVEAKKHVPGDNTCVVTHDVDMIVDSKVDYSWCDSPTQICSELSCFNGGVPYSTYAGGVVQASLKDWYTINGFTNTAIGWGGEDDDLHIRFQVNGLLTDGHVRRPAKGFGKCHCMNDNDHTKRVRDEKGYSDIVAKISRMGHGSNEWKTDGLNSLQYHVSEESVDEYGTICLKVKTTAPTHELSGQRMMIRSLKIPTLKQKLAQTAFPTPKAPRNVYFITYANSKYDRAKNRIVKEAQNSKWFIRARGFGPGDLSKTFRDKYSNVLSRNRGGGYWIWKYAIIEETLKTMNTGDYLVYADAGCSINQHGKERFDEYIDMLEASDMDIISFNTPFHQEHTWTTEHIFKYFNISTNDRIRTSGQHVGGVLILQKGPHLRKWLNLINKALEEDALMFTDEYNPHTRHTGFKDNRHDQSVSSVTRKIVGSIVIPDDTYPPNQKEFPIWASRSKN